MSIKFKSSGFDSFGRKFNKKAEPNRIPIGIVTPMEPGTDTLFNMHYETAKQIKDNFRNLILTNKGERLGRPDFGCGLREILFEITAGDDFETLAMQKIREQVSRYIPAIVLDTFEIKTFETKDAGLASVTIIIKYNVPAAGVQKDVLEIDLIAGG